MTYLWSEGKPITVIANELGTPRQFTCGNATHVVKGIANRWRVDEDWWSGRVWREYFKLYTEDGLLVIVFRDFIHDTWYLQRLYD